MVRTPGCALIGVVHTPFYCLRFGLGKVHEQLKDSPSEDVPTGEGEGEGEKEVLPWELPDNVTKPEYR